MTKVIGAAAILAALLSGCATSNLEVVKCDKKINNLCVKSHVVKYNKCDKPTKIGKDTYCEVK